MDDPDPAQYQHWEINLSSQDTYASSAGTSTLPGSGDRDFWFFGAALWRQFGESFHIGVEAFHQAASVPGQPANTIGGKDTIGFNVDAVCHLSENWHVLASAGDGLQSQSVTNRCPII